MSAPYLDSALRHALYEWGSALREARAARGCSLEEVSWLVGLGERCSVQHLARVERGLEADVRLYVEYMEALGLGLRIEGLVPAEDLRQEWAEGTWAREACRRADREAL